MITKRFDITTDTSGDYTSGLQAVPGGGVVYAVQLIDGDLADGVDLTLTAETGETSIAILTYANFNTDQIVYPRVLEALNTDGTALSTHCMPFVFGSLKVVIAQGGSVKSGTVIVHIIDL